MRRELQRVERAARKAALAREELHAAIRAAAAKHTVREIGAAAGLSHQRIHQIQHGR